MEMSLPYSGLSLTTEWGEPGVLSLVVILFSITQRAVVIGQWSVWSEDLSQLSFNHHYLTDDRYYRNTGISTLQGR